MMNIGHTGPLRTCNLSRPIEVMVLMRWRGADLHQGTGLSLDAEYMTATQTYDVINNQLAKRGMVHI